MNYLGIFGIAMLVVIAAALLFLRNVLIGIKERQASLGEDLAKLVKDARELKRELESGDGISSPEIIASRKRRPDAGLTEQALLDAMQENSRLNERLEKLRKIADQCFEELDSCACPNCTLVRLARKGSSDA